MGRVAKAASVRDRGGEIKSVRSSAKEGVLCLLSSFVFLPRALTGRYHATVRVRVLPIRRRQAIGESSSSTPPRPRRAVLGLARSLGRVSAETHARGNPAFGRAGKEGKKTRQRKITKNRPKGTQTRTPFSHFICFFMCSFLRRPPPRRDETRGGCRGNARRRHPIWARLSGNRHRSTTTVSCPVLAYFFLSICRSPHINATRDHALDLPTLFSSSRSPVSLPSPCSSFFTSFLFTSFFSFPFLSTCGSRL